MFLFSSVAYPSMERWIYPIVGVVVVLLALFLIPTTHHGIAILLLLGIILYGLFYNPMHAMHRHTFGEKKERATFPKKKKRKKA